jgi:hypothetical protein
LPAGLITAIPNLSDALKPEGGIEGGRNLALDFVAVVISICSHRNMGFDRGDLARRDANPDGDLMPVQAGISLSDSNGTKLLLQSRRDGKSRLR